MPTLEKMIIDNRKHITSLEVDTESLVVQVAILKMGLSKTYPLRHDEIRASQYELER